MAGSTFVRLASKLTAGCMRLGYVLPFSLLFNSPVGAYGLDATGSNWGRDNYGHSRHLAWVSRYADVNSIQGVLLDTCLDHITSGRNEDIPKNVAKVKLIKLTHWCLDIIQPLITDPQKASGKTFRYPGGIVELE
jgi:hypothetical protein